MTTRNRPAKTLLVALALLPALGAGCTTPLLWEGIEDMTDDYEQTEVPGAEPDRLLRAARDGEGRYALLVRYTDGSERVFAWRPTLPPAPSDGEWPADAAPAPPERLRFADEPFPADREPGWVPLDVVGAPAPPRLLGPPDDDGGPADPWPTFRLRDDVVDFREGHEHFHPVAQLPYLEPRTERGEAGVDAGDVLWVSLGVVATPATVALDVSVFGLLFGLALI